MAVLVGGSDHLPGRILRQHPGNDETGIRRQHGPKLLGGTGLETIVHLAVHHVPNFFQPVVKFRAEVHQTGHFQQLGHGVEVAVHGIRHARVLNLQHQLQAVAAPHCPVHLAQGGGPNGLRINFQFRQAAGAQFFRQHPLDGGPGQRGGLVFQGVQCLGHLFR